MALTEIVVLPLKASEDLRAELYNKLPGSLQSTFNVAGGPKASALARVLKSTPANADNHSGYLAVFNWENLDVIQDFVKTAEFVNFKSSLMNYLESPPVLQFFEAASGVIPEKTLHGSTHFFIIKATGSEVQVSQAKDRWDDITAAFSNIAGDQVEYHSGDGRVDYEGHFAGFSGWKSSTALNDTLGHANVREQLQALENSGANISSFTLELEHVF